MTVRELQTFLKAANAKVSGNKPDLIKRAKLYAEKQANALENNEDLPSTSANTIVQENAALEAKRKIFYEDHDYFDITTVSRISIPENFNSATIDQFLTSWHLYVNGEEVNAATFKPADKGGDMYSSKMIQFAEYCQVQMPFGQGLLLFRANINASMHQQVQ